MYGLNLDADSSPRFDPRRFLEWSDDMYDVLSSSFFEKIEELPMAGLYRDRQGKGRLDNLSYRLYNTTSYWWVLALYNFMPNHKYAAEGTQIRYFNVADLERMLFSLKSEK